MPHANSMFSRPRATSPSASAGTLPCSAVSSAAMLLAVLVDQVADPEQDLGPLATATSRARPGTRPSPRRRRRRPPPRREVDPLRLRRRSPGRTPAPGGPTSPGRDGRRSSGRSWAARSEAEPAGSASWVIEGPPPAEGRAAGLFPPLYSGTQAAGDGRPARGTAQTAPAGRSAPGPGRRVRPIGIGIGREARRIRSGRSRDGVIAAHRRPRRGARTPRSRPRSRAPGRPTAAEDDRVPPRERDNRAGHGPQGDAEQERPGAATREQARGEHDGHHHHDADRRQRLVHLRRVRRHLRHRDSHGPGPR